MINKREFYIDGQWVMPIEPCDLEVINPADEKVIGIVSQGTKRDVDLAVKAAQKGLEAMSETSFEQRMGWLKNLLAITKRRYDELAHVLSLELGAPITMAKEQQIDAGVGHLEAFIEAMHEIKWRTTLKNDDVILREPIGICGLITPWNWPINQIALKVVPALATGCSCILKPSEYTPLNAVIYAEMIAEAGFPDGAFNLIQGTGETVGVALSEHEDVQLVSFTGSKRAGALVSKAGADSVKKIILELGGKSPNLVFADSDLENTVASSVLEIFNNSGQSCDAPTRMLVERVVYNQVIELAIATAKKVKCDLPSKKGDHIGPLINLIQYQKVTQLIRSGISEGARLLIGGPEKPKNLKKGYYVQPTIFSDVTPSMQIYREEIFGPVLSITAFDHEDEAIAMANDTSYGLAAYIQTDDQARAQRVAKKIRAGNIHINGAPYQYGSPFGGYKHSGIGREGGVWGLEDLTEIKAIHAPF
ncbi:MAG: aldehyde dehydrogenase family protein [Pseudomonadota bacterium]